MKRVLLIAFHFPPLAGSSGIQRALHLALQLPTHGWSASVLTAHSRAYERIDERAHAQPSAGLEVRRAFALDAGRHLTIAGKYPGWLARPDRFTSWILGAIPVGLSMIRRHRPDILFSTYPVPSAHVIAYWLSRLSGIPWIADFRDPMAHEGYPEDAATWESYVKVERLAIRQAAALVFTCPGAARLYATRYPARAAHIHVVENGYDEQSFEAAQALGPSTPLNEGAFTILHSGIVYPKWRNPANLFAALRRLRPTSATFARLKLRFRAPVHDEWLSDLAAHHDVAEHVEILPPIPYVDALAEMLRSDALLVLQGDSCSDQIPAKVYEYLRAGLPILGLASGDTANLLRRAGCPALASLESAPAVAQALDTLLASPRTPPSHAEQVAAGATRQARTGELARLLAHYSCNTPNRYGSALDH